MSSPPDEALTIATTVTGAAAHAWQTRAGRSSAPTRTGPTFCTSWWSKSHQAALLPRWPCTGFSTRPQQRGRCRLGQASWEAPTTEFLELFSLLRAVDIQAQHGWLRSHSLGSQETLYSRFAFLFQLFEMSQRPGSSSASSGRLPWSTATDLTQLLHLFPASTQGRLGESQKDSHLLSLKYPLTRAGHTDL